MANSQCMIVLLNERFDITGEPWYIGMLNSYLIITEHMYINSVMFKLYTDEKNCSYVIKEDSIVRNIKHIIQVYPESERKFHIKTS